MELKRPVILFDSPALNCLGAKCKVNAGKTKALFQWRGRRSDTGFDPASASYWRVFNACERGLPINSSNSEREG